MKFLHQRLYKLFIAAFGLLLILGQASLLQPTQGALAAPSERPLAASAPSVTLNVPDEAFIGDTVTFTVTFDNQDPADPGYGPIIDLVIPSNGIDGAPNPDGFSFISASFLGTNVTYDLQTVPGSGCVTHPYMVNNTGAAVQVCGLTPGDTFVAIQLPFGSFTPDQPPATVEVTVAMSNWADLGAPLFFQARGGYQYGYDPLDNPATDNPAATIGGWATDSLTPILYTLTKTYIGPEDETATGPNFPRQYTITAQIAPGQTLNPFNLTDLLPNNMQFLGIVSTSPGGASCTTPSTTVPGGTLSCDFGAVSGTVTLTFEYYIPLRDAGSSSVIDPVSGDDVLSCNNASASGDWVPLDPRDVADGGTQTKDPTGCEHELTDKSIAIQKGVTGSGLPDSVLTYTLDFQISDYFAFNDIFISDVISDGQHFDPSFVPTLSINGNTYTLPPAAMQDTNVEVACNYTGATASPPAPPGECDSLNPGPNDGTTTITFRVSQEILARGQNGSMVGGCVPLTGLTGDPDCGAYNDGPTTGQIIFHTRVQQNFTDNYAPGDESVDQGDILSNGVVIDGAVLNNTDLSPNGAREADDSAASVRLPVGALSKSIYAINGSTSLPSPVEVTPGDSVTYRLVYTLPTGDVENFYIEDYLPLPVFRVGDPDGDGAPGPAWTFDPTVSAAAPPAGTAKFGPSDSFYAYSGVNPGVVSNSTNNSLRFNYGNFDGPTEQVYRADILLTVTVLADPFADRLFLTNQAHANEGSTFQEETVADDIVQIVLTEPVLRIVKSAVATDRTSGAIFTPALPLTFSPPGSFPGPRWTGVLSSSNIPDSNLSGLDAGDLVTFAVIIRNDGTSINGAYDLVVRDTYDAAAFEWPIPGDANSLNLQVYRGDRTGPIAYTQPGGGAATADALFSGAGIELVDPAPPSPGVIGGGGPHATPGANIIVITYDLRLTAAVTPRASYTNTGYLVNYAGTEGGPDHLNSPREDDATVTVRDPAAAKSLIGTEIVDGNNSNTQAVIGEIITYELVLTIPEGLTPGATVVDTLNTGLAFVDLLSVSASGDVTSSIAWPAQSTAGTNVGDNPQVITVGGQAGRRITFNLGDLTNANRDNSVAETITIRYRAVVLNIPANQAGASRRNAAVFSWTGGSLGNALAAPVTIIEPTVGTTKTVSPTTADAGDTVTFTVTLSNPAGGPTPATTAYDVTWSDTLPAGLTYVAGTLNGSCTTNTLNLDDTAAPTLTGTASQINASETCTITFNASIDYSVTPGQTLTNTAQTRWTSLPPSVGSPNDRSPYNGDSDERTGEDGLLNGGSLNDYRTEGSAGVTIDAVAPDKYLVATSEAHTSDPNMTIGEIVRYRLVVQIPEGTIPNFQIRDNLPTGLTFLNDGTARVAFVSNGSGITSSAVGTLPVPAINNPACFLTGNTADGTTPSIPAACVLADANIGSTDSTSANVDTYNTGTDVFFKLGNLANNDSDGDAEYVVIEFNALVDNTAAGSNDAGDDRDNTFNVFIDGVQNGSTSNPIRVHIVEPLLTLDKTASYSTPLDAGDPITYTLTIAADGGVDRATAFDLSLSDTFDPNLANLTVTSVATTQTGTCTGGRTFTHNGGTFAGGVLTFTASCLDPGQTITLTISATVAANAPVGYTIPNTATVTWTSLPDGGTSGNPTGSDTPGNSGDDDGERNGSGTGENDYSATDDADATLNTPIALKLAPTPSEYTIGEQVTYYIRVTLPEGLTPNLQVIDALPAGLRYFAHTVITSAAASNGNLSADYAGTFTTTPPSFSCAGSCASGDDITLTFGDTTTTADNNAGNNAFLVQVTAVVVNELSNQNGVTLTNTGIVRWTGGEDENSTDIRLIEPELEVVKTVDNATPGIGQTFTYTLTVQHLSTSTADAYDVTLSDPLPANVNRTSAPVFTSAPAGCATPTDTTSGNTVGFLVPHLPLGCVLTVSFNAQIDTSAVSPGATFTNTAHIEWTSTDGNNPEERTGDSGTDPVNDYENDDSVVVTYTAIDLAIVKDDGGISTAAGGVVVYQLDYSNVGNGDATGVIITETVPANATFNAASSTPGWSCADGAPAGTVCTFSVGALAAGASGTVNFAVTVDNPLPDGVTQIDNSTSITDDGTHGDDADPSNNDDDDDTPVDAAPDMAITKDDGVTILIPGQSTTYTLTISNVGTQDATGVVITDALPPNTIFVSASDGGVYDSLTHVVTWPTISLFPAGNVITRTVTIQLPIPYPAITVVNQAHVEDDGSNGPDPTPDNNDDDDVDHYMAVDLQIFKDDGGITSAAGGVVVYQLDYSNVGTQDATGVVITETVPANATFNAASSTPGWSCADGAPAGTVCTFSVGALAAGASGTVNFAVTVDNPLPDSVTQIDNSTSITDDGTHGNDNNPSDNDDDDDTPVVAAPDMAITKDDGVTVVSPGEIVTYTLTISNVGTQDATGVVVTDTLPDHVTFISASDSGVYDSLTRVITWPTIPLVAAGAPAITYTVTVQVDDPFPSTVTSITNNAHVEDDGSNGPDQDPSNNDDDDTDSVLSSIVNIDFNKTLLGTDQGFTTDPRVAIGEIATYEVIFRVPAGGTMSDLVLIDTLDRGLAFVECLSITPSSTDVSTTLSGGFADACNDPSNPTVQTYPAGSTNPADRGRLITFNLGEVSNTGSDDRTVSVQYNVIVLDSLENLDGLKLTNHAQLIWSSGALEIVAPPLEIVEPEMVITKEASPTVAPLGSTITFTLSVEHTPESRIEAYDVLVSDVLPAGLGYVDGSAVASGLAPTSISYNPTNQELSIFWDVFPLGQTATITFQARFLGPSPVTNETHLVWTSLPIDPQPNGDPVPRSDYNDLAHERWYDPADPAGIDNYGASSSAIITAPRRLPATGFAPDRITPLPEQPAAKAYTNLGDMWLEIPSLGLNLPLTGVPLESDGWDLTWLSNQAGYLSGTTFPGQIGTTGLTAHVTLADGTPGPFRNLDQLHWGHTVILHANGYRYTYEVREMRTVLPNDFSIFKQDGYTWMTLVTCKGYVPWLDTYNYRYAVRAVLLTVTYEGPSPALQRGLSRQ